MKDLRDLKGIAFAWLLFAIGAFFSLPFQLEAFYYWLTVKVENGDSWEPMRQAYEWYKSSQGGEIYPHIFFQLHTKFQYPPSSLLLFRAADLFHFQLTNSFLNQVSWFSGAAQAIGVASIVYLLWQKGGLAGKDRIHGWFGVLLIALMSLVFYPIMRGYVMGQVQTWLNAWFVIACLCWICDRRFLAGVLIGAICLFKPQLSLFLIWAAIRKQGQFLFGWAAIVLLGLSMSLATFGLQNHLDYLSVLQFMAHHGEYAYTNQSVNGLLNRLVGNTSVGNTYPAYNSFVYLSTVISSAILVGSAMFYRFRSRVIGVSDFLIAGLTFTFASPIVWDHHLGILPACFAVLLVTIEGMAPTRKRDLFAGILAMSYSLSTYPLRTFLAHPTGWFSILQSTMFLGAAGVLFLLYAVRDGVEPGEPQLHHS